MLRYLIVIMIHGTEEKTQETMQNCTTTPDWQSALGLSRSTINGFTSPHFVWGYIIMIFGN